MGDNGNSALDRLKVPSIAMIGFGGLGLLKSLVDIAFLMFGTSMQAMVMQRMQQENPELPPGFGLLFGTAGTALGLISIGLQLATSGFVLYAGTRMINARDHGICMAGAIVALIPCFNACCCVGIPIGIWALIVLNRADVRSHFNATNAG